MKISYRFILFLAVLLLAALACSLGTNASDTPTPAQIEATVPVATVAVQSTSNGPTVISNQITTGQLELEGALISLYQLANPSVVHILVYTSESDALPLSSGSGFIYDTNGRIVTNNHVVENGEVFEVIFADANRRRAEVIGRDVDSDLAVIKVDSLPTGIVPLPLGDSDQLLVGQLVVAIGNPFGEQGSMSVGIVSGLGRSLESQRETESLGGRYSLPEVVQTDAPINPGNSGGPLLNLNGEVVGVNSAIRSTTGVNSGVGFAIPVNAIRRVVPSLIENGAYVYSYMGIQIRSLNLNLQDRFQLPQVSGAYVVGVTAGGPSDEAGLIAARESDLLGGDLITAIDGQLVRDTEELIAYLVFNTEVGQTVELTIIRGGETIELPLTLGARP